MRPLIAVLALALLVPAAHAGERHTVRGSDIRIWNLAGSVTLAPASGSDVVVDVSREGRDAEKLRIANGPLDGAQTLRVLYPDAKRVVYRRPGWNSSSSMTVRPDGRFGSGSGPSGRRVTVATNGSGLDAHADLRIEVPKGQRLRVYLGVGAMSAENVDGEIVLDIASGSVESRAGSGALTVDTGSGAVDVQGHDGELLVDTGSGAVGISDVRAQRVHVDTGSGAVRGTEIRADKVDIDTGSGAVDLAGVSAANVHVDTGSGAVRLELLHDSPSVYVDTGSGGVQLSVPSSLSARLDLDAGSGGVRCSLPVTVHSRDSGALKATAGDGRGSIRVDTGSGGVTIAAAAQRR